MAMRRLSMMALGLAFLPLAALAYAGRRAEQPPENNPRRFVKRARRRPGAKVVACVGASIVHGRVSYNFVDALERRLEAGGFQLVNAGVNGDLAYNARQRLDEVIACQPDFVIVLVGTNDVLATMSPRHERRYRRL